MTLPVPQLYDYRDGGLARFATDHADQAGELIETVLRGMGPVGRAARGVLSVADRMAERRLVAMRDPYLDEIRQVARKVGRPGAIAFSLSYEFGCTTRAMGDTLFRTLDWPFRGLGERIAIVRLSGAGGDWLTATWPGVMGTLHGAAPGRFAAALNQAPERGVRAGRAAAWIDSKRRVLRAGGLPPPHLLRRVFETARGYAQARQMLAETEVSCPVIYTLMGPDRAETIERTETAFAIAPAPAAANHFESRLGLGRWRARGFDSTGRRAAVLAMDAPPKLDALTPPILNDLTRLAVSMTLDARLRVAGYDGAKRTTELGEGTA